MEKRKNQVGGRRTLLILFLAGGWLLTSLPCSGAADTLTNSSQASLPPDISRLRFTPGIADVLKLVKANVDAEVIKAFVKHSPISYNPSAQEIIVLKRFGVPNDVIEALLAHQPWRPQEPMPAYEARSEPPPPEPAPAGMGFAPPPFPQYYPPPTPTTVVIPPTGPLISFNNSYPTFVNGQAVYSGYYAPGYGVLW